MFPRAPERLCRSGEVTREVTPLRRSYQDAGESELLGWARDGDTRAFARLVEQAHPMLHRVCYRITHHEQDAQDALQTALAAAWRSLAGFEGRSRFSTWLYQIASNAALEQVRRRDALPSGELAEEIWTTGRSPEAIVTDVDAVRWALGRIPPDFRAALVLREYGGLTYAEIAQAQGIRVETVKTRIARARQAMVRLLAER